MKSVSGKRIYIFNLQMIAGVPIDHSFLKYKKELLEYGFCVGKISMKEETVMFQRVISHSPAKVFGDSDMRGCDFCGSSGRTLYQDRKGRMIVIWTNKDKKSREGK